jgi:type I site-specific restriction endonuclease
VKSCETVVFLRAGASAIDVPQSVGRGTRLFTFPDGRKKTSFNLVDVDVRLSEDRAYETGDARSMTCVHRHAISRVEEYNNLYPGTLQWL